MYPESLGQYNIIRDVFRNDHPVYKHVDRDDRFIVYYGNIEYIHFNNIVLIFTYFQTTGTSHKTWTRQLETSEMYKMGELCFLLRTGNIVLKVVRQQGNKLKETHIA